MADPVVQAEPRTRSTFPFLSLPAELRNIIHIYAVNFSNKQQGCTESGILAAREKPPMDVVNFQEALSHPILHLNRQIRLEALPLLFEENQFKFIWSTDMYRFFSFAGDLARHHLRSISIEYDLFLSPCHPSSIIPIIHIISRLKRLEELDIHVSDGDLLAWVRKHKYLARREGYKELCDTPVIAALLQLRGLELKLAFTNEVLEKARWNKWLSWLSRKLLKSARQPKTVRRRTMTQILSEAEVMHG